MPLYGLGGRDFLSDDMIKPMNSLNTQTKNWLHGLIGAQFEVEKHNYSNQDDVYKIKTSDKVYYLKISDDLQNEYDNILRLQVLVVTPRVIGFTELGGQDHLLMSEIPGRNLAEYVGDWKNEAIAKAFAKALQQMHSLDVQRIFPGTDRSDEVVLHGDMSLPNIIAMRDGRLGYIDLGQVTIGSRDNDLADAIWSLQRNIGPDYGKYFLSEYGDETITPKIKKALAYRYLPDDR